MPVLRQVRMRWALLILAPGLGACMAAGLLSGAAESSPQGSVTLEDGQCCVGGVAGRAITVHASFRSSPSVTQMRTRPGLQAFDEADLSQSEWEPFSSTKTFSFVPPLNWVGFYVTVQFKDGAGNLSPVYVDDISVEGMPPGAPGATP